MSADNWTFCPRCTSIENLRIVDLARQISEGYGVLPVDEFDAHERAEGDASEVDTVRGFVRGLSWQEVTLILAAMVMFVALCFAPAASCSISSTPDTTSTTTVPR